MAGYSTPAWTNNSAPAIDATALSNIGQGVELSEHPYGVCSTATGTAAKTVTIDFSGTLSLFSGMEIRVKFTNANTASSPTLNVNSTGAVPIMLYGTTAAGSGAWRAGEVIPFRYDGTNWIMGASKMISANNTTNLDGVLIGNGSNVGTMFVSNPNLIDNWYFVGGGSTQTEDRFPINSRELTTYTGLGYTIDRWKTSNSNTTVSLTAQGLTTSASSGATPYLLQPISYQSELLGKTVTLSILTTSGLYYATATLPSTAPSSTSVYTSLTNIGQILYLYSAGTGIWHVRFTGATDGGNTYIAAKLELGDTQTLAHQENGAWVLNELPSFAEQQMRCYRYYLRLPTYVRYPLTRYTSNTLDFIVPIPIRMRTTPTIENSSLFTVMSGTSAASGTYSFSVTGNGNNALGIRATAGSGTTVPSVSSGICLQISNGAALTAEI